MPKIKVIIFFFFLIKVFCLENENTITILDDIKNGLDIVPLNINNDYLMMLIIEKMFCILINFIAYIKGVRTVQMVTIIILK